MIRFFYNGLKVNNERLVKGRWSYVTFVDKRPPSLRFYAEGYGDLPCEVRELFTVTNNSDILTDYFEPDRFDIRPGHPLFPEAVDAAARRLNRAIAKCERRSQQDYVDLYRREAALLLDLVFEHESLTKKGPPHA